MKKQPIKTQIHATILVMVGRSRRPKRSMTGLPQKIVRSTAVSGTMGRLWLNIVQSMAAMLRLTVCPL